MKCSAGKTEEKSVKEVTAAIITEELWAVNIGKTH